MQDIAERSAFLVAGGTVRAAWRYESARCRTSTSCSPQPASSRRTPPQPPERVRPRASAPRTASPRTAPGRRAAAAPDAVDVVDALDVADREAVVGPVDDLDGVAGAELALLDDAQVRAWTAGVREAARETRDRPCARRASSTGSSAGTPRAARCRPASARRSARRSRRCRGPSGSRRTSRARATARARAPTTPDPPARTHRSPCPARRGRCGRPGRRRRRSHPRRARGPPPGTSRSRSSHGARATRSRGASPR